MGTIYILSTIATTSMEDVAAAAPNARRWYQLYVYKNRLVSWLNRLILREVF